jgi:hypothetical protein
MVILCCCPQIEQLLKLGRLVIALAGARPALYEVTDLMKEALQAAPNVHLIEDRLVTLVEAAQVGWQHAVQAYHVFLLQVGVTLEQRPVHG